jgi:tetratricopeptide (TPR) repeat protein
MVFTAMHRRIVIALLTLVLVTITPMAPAVAFSSSSSDSVSDDPDMRKGNAAVIEKRYEDALMSYDRALERDPENADAWSQSGFAHRKLGHFEKSLEAYHHALEIEPFHLGANEYLGELYLQTDQVEKAQEMLGILRRACPTGCDELDDLTDAINAYRDSGGQIKWNK